jgi:(2Fe-2S) ferredoxin
MQKPEHHFLVCASFRVSGEPQGVCRKKNAIGLLQSLEEGILDRGLDAIVSSTGCLKLCEKGPVVVVYPEGLWYGGVDEDAIEEILDAVESGGTADAYLISE